MYLYCYIKNGCLRNVMFVTILFLLAHIIDDTWNICSELLNI